MANNKEVNSWPKENVPHDAILYMRVHRQYINDDGELAPGVFKNHGSGMSTDWNKYSTPTITLERAKDLSQNGVIEMGAGDARDIPGQTVEHTPDFVGNNRAHTDVFGEKDPEVRLKFTRIYKWSIPLSI